MPKIFLFSASNALTGEGLSEGVEWLTGITSLTSFCDCGDSHLVVKHKKNNK